MTLLERTIDGELPDLQAKNVRFRVIGRLAGIPAGVRRRIERVVAETAANTGLTLVLALNYGGARRAGGRGAPARPRGARGRARRGGDRRGGGGARRCTPDDMPDPDLLIRTSGEMRVSNFLLWQIAYTELWVTPDACGPTSAARDLCMAVAEYPASRPPLRSRVMAEVGGMPMPTETHAPSRGIALLKRVASTLVLLPAVPLDRDGRAHLGVRRHRRARGRPRAVGVHRHVRARGRARRSACSASWAACSSRRASRCRSRSAWCSPPCSSGALTAAALAAAPAGRGTGSRDRHRVRHRLRELAAGLRVLAARPRGGGGVGPPPRLGDVAGRDRRLSGRLHRRASPAGAPREPEQDGGGRPRPARGLGAGGADRAGSGSSPRWG